MHTEQPSHINHPETASQVYPQDTCVGHFLNAFKTTLAYTPVDTQMGPGPMD